MIYFNGKYLPAKDAKLEPNDRGFLLGDGLFETLKCYEGTVNHLPDHFNRLKKSADELGMPFPLSFQELQAAVYLLLEKNALNGKHASVRITFTRGTGPRGLLPPEPATPTLMITAAPFVSAPHQPLKVVISNIRRNDCSPLSKIKSLCYLDNILAKQKAVKEGANDCILLNTKGNVACASAANLFIVTENKIITPPIEDGILPGITRKIVIDLCKSNGLPLYEQSINTQDLMNAKEVFFTNRLIEIQPVVQINSQLINEGKIGKTTTLIQKLYNNDILSQRKCPSEEKIQEKTIRSSL